MCEGLENIEYAEDNSLVSVIYSNRSPRVMMFQNYFDGLTAQLLQMSDTME